MKLILRIFRLYVRVTKVEKEEIEARARLAGLSNSEYIRKTALGCRVIAKSELNTLRELRRLGGLIKYVFTESHGLYNVAVTEALNSLTSYTRALERKLS